MVKTEKKWSEIITDKKAIEEAQNWLNDGTQILLGKHGEKEHQLEETRNALLVLNRIREENNPTKLYAMSEEALAKISLMLDIDSIDVHFSIQALRSLGIVGIGAMKREIIPTEHAKDREIYDNIIITYIYPVARLFAEAIRRMTPAIQNKIIKPGDSGWSTIKFQIDQWRKSQRAAKLEDVGAIRLLPMATNNIYSGYSKDLELDKKNEARNLVKFNVLIKSLLEMGVGLCAAKAEKDLPEAVENLRQLDIEIEKFFRNR